MALHEKHSSRGELWDRELDLRYTWQSLKFENESLQGTHQLLSPGRGCARYQKVRRGDRHNTPLLLFTTTASKANHHGIRDISTGK